MISCVWPQDRFTSLNKFDGHEFSSDKHNMLTDTFNLLITANVKSRKNKNGEM